MTALGNWIRIHENINHDPKMLSLEVDARWLYVSAICYSKRNLWDGLIYAGSLPNLAVESGLTEMSARTSADTLVERGLFEITPDGWVIVGFTDWQQTKADIEAQRSKWADQKRIQRERKSAKSPEPVRADIPRSPDGVRSLEEETEKRTPPNQQFSKTVWAQAERAGIPTDVLRKAREDYPDQRAEPTPGGLADHIASRYAPKGRGMDDHYRLHGPPSEAKWPLKALAKRAGWS